MSLNQKQIDELLNFHKKHKPKTTFSYHFSNFSIFTLCILVAFSVGVYFGPDVQIELGLKTPIEEYLGTQALTKIHSADGVCSQKGIKRFSFNADACGVVSASANVLKTASPESLVTIHPQEVAQTGQLGKSIAQSGITLGRNSSVDAQLIQELKRRHKSLENLLRVTKKSKDGCVYLNGKLLRDHIKFLNDFQEFSTVIQKKNLQFKPVDVLRSKWGSRKSPEMVASILTHAMDQNLHPYLIYTQTEHESAFNKNARSPVGARGYMQLMPATAKKLGVKNITDPFQNIGGGTVYMKENLQNNGWNLTKTWAAYNAGSGAVSKYHGIPPYTETVVYVFRNLVGFVDAVQ